LTPRRRGKIFQARWQGLLLDEPLERSKVLFKFDLKVLMDAEGAKKRNIHRFSNAQAKGQGQKISVNITYSIY